MGCNKEMLEPTNEDFNVKAFISNIKSYNVNADYVETVIPTDTTSSEMPYLSLQSWVIKGKDILMSITVPDDAEELYFGAVNSEAEYMGLDFKGHDQKTATGYYRLELKNLTKSGTVSNGLTNYQVVLSSNEDIQLDKFDMIASYKTANGISNKTSVPMDVKSIDPYQKTLKVGFRPLSGYTYTININTPTGGNITYSYNKGTGTETFNSQSPDATLSYDSNLDFKWIDFSDPQFGGYKMTATIQIDITGGSQYIYLLMAIVSEGKIDQLDLDADIQQTGQNTAVGKVNVGFSYFQEYQYKVEIEPIVTNGIKRIHKGEEKTIKVNVQPSPLSNGDIITLELKTKNGIMDAVFENQTTTTTITGTTTIKIIGFKNSTIKDNVTLVAKHNTTELASQKFSVRTWPINFTQQIFPFPSSDPLGGLLKINCNWESESGNFQDLSGIHIGEWVDYPGSGPIYNYSSPPYRDGSFGVLYNVEDPFIKNFVIGQPTKTGTVIWSGFGDTHRIPTTNSDNEDSHNLDVAFKKPYKTDVYICIQFYRFNDSIIMGDNNFSNLSGPHYIRRNVYEEPINSGVWKYRIEKDGVAAERILP